MLNNINAFAQITNVNVAKRQVKGVLTLEVKDKMNPPRIMDYDESKPYFQSWSDEIYNATEGKSYGNVRLMHGLQTSGRIAEPLVFDDANKQILCVAEISDDQVWNGCVSGDYCGFSWSGFRVPPSASVVQKWSKLQDGNYRYIGRPVEVSIVDNPNQPGAYFTVLNSAGVPAFSIEKEDGTVEEHVFNAATLWSISDLAAKIAELKWTYTGNEELDAKFDKIILELYNMLGKMVKDSKAEFKLISEENINNTTIGESKMADETKKEPVPPTPVPPTPVPPPTPTPESISNAVQGEIQNAVTSAVTAAKGQIVEEITNSLKGIIENAVNGLGLAELKSTVDKLAAATPEVTTAVTKSGDSAQTPTKTEVQNTITGIDKDDPRFEAANLIASQRAAARPKV